MKKLKKQISESFFNPILYFLPLLVFIIGNNFWRLDIAWKISFPIAMFLLFYVYRFYNRLFVWFVALSAGYVMIGLIYSLFFYESGLPLFFSYYTDELLFLMMLVILLLSRKNISKIARRKLLHRTPMSNNLDELFRISVVFIIIVAFFTLVFLILGQQYNDINHKYIQIINYIYLSIISFSVVYEFIRVFYIRNRLMKEDWVPIVSKSGKVIGKEPYFSRVLGEKKYMHPIVRMHIINDGKILLHQYSEDNPLHPQMWDTAVNTHVKMNETIDAALKRATKSAYGEEMNNTVFVSNYSHENKVEFEYIFLFVSCKQTVLNAENSKWWTQMQIKENLNSGIFTENFLHEYALLERSGLIFSPRSICHCDCELKELAGNQHRSPNINPNPKHVQPIANIAK